MHSLKDVVALYYYEIDNNDPNLIRVGSPAYLWLVEHEFYDDNTPKYVVRSEKQPHISLDFTEKGFASMLNEGYKFIYSAQDLLVHRMKYQ